MKTIPFVVLLCGVGFIAVASYVAGKSSPSREPAQTQAAIVQQDAAAVPEGSESDNPRAQYKWGKKYAQGDGVIQDDKKSVELFEKSAAQGNADAQDALGQLYGHGWSGVPEDVNKAVELFRQSAAQENDDAQLMLGLMYVMGKGVPADPAIAAQWFGKSAANGNPVAQRTLGEMLYRGQGIPKDEAKGLELLKQASAQGDSKASELVMSSYDKKN